MRVGVIGGGQLARMMIPPAVELGIELRVLAENEGSSAALAATAVGDYRDAATVLAFARDVDVVTFDHEHVPQPVLARARRRRRRRAPRPRRARRRAGQAAHARAADARSALPVPAWARGARRRRARRLPRDARRRRGREDARAAATTARACASCARRDGGRRLVRGSTSTRPAGRCSSRSSWTSAASWRSSVARRPSGEVAAWPLVETVQRDGVCAEVIAPAPGAGGLAEAARELAARIADGLDVTGVLAVELFETADGRLLVNELAMRPHNTGHWTIDGAVTSQFEQHLRAVLDLPLGRPAPRAPWSVMVNVLGGPAGATMPDRYPAALADAARRRSSTPTARSRGRAARSATSPATGDDLDDVRRRARAAAAFFQN